jgi:hypothetical protein
MKNFALLVFLVSVFAFPQVNNIGKHRTVAVTGPFLSCNQTNGTTGTTSNLTSAGTTDWIMWNQIPTTERKSGGGSLISTYSFVPGAFTPVSTTTRLRTSTWTGGTPDATGSVTTGVFNQRNVANQGFSFTCPASDTSHTCIAYLEFNVGPATLVAHLSDSSASDYTFGTGTTGTAKWETFTCSYKAGSPAQTLTFTWTSNLSGSPGVFVEGAAYQ